MKKRLLIWGMFLPWLSMAEAIPKKVIIIRHAEKVKGENTLSLQGLERAAALPYYFSGTPLYNDPALRFFFAARPTKSDPSFRPTQTCTPIANYYKAPLNTDFTRKETDEIAQELLNNPRYDKATVLICWSHGHIQPLVLALGGEDPGKWDSDVFDQVYLLTFDGSNTPKLQKILQKLMFGDRESFNR